MKRILLSVSLILSVWATLSGQSLMNEWIDFNKTYYKFTIGATGPHRITQAQLAALGLGGVDAAHFQLWRQGQQIPLYTSVPAGSLPTNGFIEFFGQANNGEWESRLYINPDFQINERVSLFTDSVAYFLTVNPVGGNLRLAETANNLASALPAEPFFMHKAGVAFRNAYSPGFAAVVGDFVYSASYDAGEGYVSGEFRPAAPLNSTLNNLFVAPGGPEASLYFSAAGRALNTRTVQVVLNGSTLVDREMNFFNTVKDNSANAIPLSLLSSNTAAFQFRTTSSVANDRMVVGRYELTYPRQFNFGGQNIFEFELPASTAGNNLVITNFNAGSVAPVLYDLTNRLRITADVSVPGQVRVVLPPSSTARRLVLSSVDGAAVRSVAGLTTRNFVNYNVTANQSDYIIISNPIIYNDQAGVNQVEAYRAYRSSTAGGGFNAKVYDINQLIDQFGWGIKNNPMSIRNFLRFARVNFAVKPKYTFIIGKGVAAQVFRSVEWWNNINRLNLVPTFGVPQSDLMLAADEGSIVPQIPVGRLNAVSATEVKDYLGKVVQYEQAQANVSCAIDDELWKKDMIHIGGANDFLGEQIMFYLNQYKQTAEDTLKGATVYTLQKSSVASVQTIAGQTITRLFTDGFSMLTYFGHSSANTLEFNLDNPDNYPASGRFPIFLVNGCNAGNLFQADSLRFSGSYTLSEKYVLSTPGKGAIAFIASTHLGIVNYLHLYTEEFYRQMTVKQYGKSIGKIMQAVVDSLIDRYSMNDFYVRMHAEEITLHGDPAIVFYSREKPDYAIEAPYIKVAPEFISIAENNFKVTVKMFNLGKAVADSVRVEVRRQLPSGNSVMLFNNRIRGIRYSDSLQLLIPIDPLVDKGLNRITVTIDPDSRIDEICETNNTVSREFFIFEDEIRPTYPYNYGVVTKQNITFFASTANPLGSVRRYYFQLDTTERFDSPILRSDSVSSAGGSIAFRPAGLTFANNTVYYWRVGMRPDGNASIVWNSTSFVYRNVAGSGFNQSHYYQYTRNRFVDLKLDADSRNFEFEKVNRKLKIKTGLFPYFRSGQNNVFLDLQEVDLWRCNFNVFSIYVFEPKTLRSWVNTAEGGGGRFGSLNPMCLGYNRRFFEYFMEDQANRNRARLFLEQIPTGSIVLVINQGTGQGGGFVGPNSAFIQQWMNDTLTFGSGNSIYHTLKNAGLTEIDKFTRNLPFAFVYEKGNPNFVRQFIGEQEADYIDVVVDVPAQLFEGTVETPWMGPAKSWERFQWDGTFPGGREPSDSLFFDLFGRTEQGAEVFLTRVRNAKDTSIAFVNAEQYPFMKVRMFNADPVNLTSFQPQYWRLLGQYVPEGAIAPNLRFTFKDTVELGEPLDLAVAFQNVSEAAFDSLELKLVITDRNNAPRDVILPKAKPLVSGDTLVVRYQIDTRDLPGLNSLYLMVNPDEDQPEQFLFNNFMYKSFFVKPDVKQPWLDVTFDGVHILNRDIVSARPHILIKLKDDNRFMALNDTAGMKVRVRYPDRSVREFRLGSDSARFNPANLANNENTATIDLFPFFQQDGDYELLVSGTDRSGNKAGDLEYTVGFQVINKAMISNLLNYPNPFTTSTAFVFTVTGAEVPQNIRIQILTVTGKVVREITKNELGPIRIGRNITEFKWDGTDQYGNKLANGIYLYRVLTNLNGKSLERYQATGDNTDQYFNRGYGKMYLMR